MPYQDQLNFMTENSKLLIALLNETTIIMMKQAVYWLVVERLQVVCEHLCNSKLCQLALQALKDCLPN